MSTTTLFVELLVTGFGALIWVVLVVLCFVKGGELSPLAKPSWIALPLIAVAYVLGVVTDRIADKVVGELVALLDAVGGLGVDAQAQVRGLAELAAAAAG